MKLKILEVGVVITRTYTDFCELEDSLVSIASSRTARALSETLGCGGGGGRSKEEIEKRERERGREGSSGREGGKEGKEGSK